MSGPVFISYSTDDKQTAEQIRDGLEKAGIPCWMAPRDIVPGKEYAEQIIDAIEACSAMVLVVSDTSNTSRFVRNEVERAVSKDKVIIPVRLHDVTLSRTLEFFISSAQWVDALVDLDSAVAALAAALRAHLGMPLIAANAPAEDMQVEPLQDDLPAQATPLVGRAREQEVLESALRTARQGMGQVVLIGGEAGIGKSRLVAEARRQAAAAQWTILTGYCFERDMLFPYASLLDALRTFLAQDRARGNGTTTPLSERLGALAGELVKLLPELALTIPDLQPTATLPPEAEKRRLFEALFQFLLRLTQGQDAHPLLLILEDIHWGDETSLDFLHLLARRARDFPVLVLATYRREDESPALRDLLGQLVRARMATEIVLKPLDVDDIGALLRSLFGTDKPAPASFVKAIYALTEGNPFFTEEVVRSLVTSDDTFFAGGKWDPKPLHDLQLPRTVRDAVQRRTGQLSPQAHQFMTLAAVVGERFDFELLQQVAVHDESSLLGILKELIAAQLVVEESTGQFAFRHALTRQAVYAELLGPERRSLHRTIAQAIEHRAAAGADGSVATLAYHYTAAGEWAPALAFAQQAGDRAQALYAPRAAIDHYNRALDAADRLSRGEAETEPDRECLASIHLNRGSAYETLSDFEKARSDFETALKIARAARHRQLEWQALVALGELWASRSYNRTGEYYREALALGRSFGDDVLIARSLNRIGNWHLNREEIDESLRAHHEAQTLFDQVGDEQGIAQTHDFLGITHLISGDSVAGENHLRQAISLFEASNMRDSLPTTLCNLAFARVATFADLGIPAEIGAEECIQLCARARRIAHEIAWPAGELYAMVAGGHALAQVCQYGKALEYAQGALKIAGDIEHHQWICLGHRYTAALYVDLGAFSTAQRHLETAMQLAHAIGSQYMASVTSGLLAVVLVTQGEFAQAASLLSTVGPPELPMRTWGQRWIWLGHAELALAEGGPESSLAILDRLVETAVNVEERDAAAIPRLALVRARCLVAIGRSAEALSLLETTRETVREHRLTRFGWHADLALARLYQSQGRPAEIEPAMSSAADGIRAIAESVPDAELREGFLRYASTQMPDADRSATGAPAGIPDSPAESHAGLTPREVEVLRLVAQGATNRDIASALTISERTVNTHLTNIYNKIDAKNRTAAAAFALQNGLA